MKCKQPKAPLITEVADYPVRFQIIVRCISHPKCACVNLERNKASQESGMSGLN